MGLAALIQMCQRHDVQRFLQTKGISGILSQGLDTAWLLFMRPALWPGSDPLRNGFEIIQIQPVDALRHSDRWLAGYGLDPGVLGHPQCFTNRLSIQFQFGQWPALEALDQ